MDACFYSIMVREVFCGEKVLLSFLKKVYCFLAFKAKSGLWKVFHKILSTIEQIGPEESLNRPLPYTPVFIVGAPRTGSTFLYQNLVKYTDFGYISNLHSFFYSNPALIQKIMGRLIQKKRTNQDFKSTYGATKGIFSPHEFGEYFYRFFRRNPQYVELKDVTPENMLAFRKSLRKLITAWGRPVIFKNMVCSVRLEAIMTYVPEAIFIEITRDFNDTACSILKARKDLLGGENRWWSIKPKGFEHIINKTPEEQINFQIISIKNEIKNKKEEYKNNFLYIQNYLLSSSPEKLIQKILYFINRS